MIWWRILVVVLWVAPKYVYAMSYVTCVICMLCSGMCMLHCVQGVHVGPFACIVSLLCHLMSFLTLGCLGCIVEWSRGEASSWPAARHSCHGDPHGTANCQASECVCTEWFGGILVSKALCYSCYCIVCIAWQHVVSIHICHQPSSRKFLPKNYQFPFHCM